MATEALTAAATVIVLIIGSILGAVLVAVIPYFRKQKAREDEYLDLKNKDESTLSPQEKKFIENFESGKTIPFLKMYKYTLIIGVFTGFFLALTSYAGIITNLPQENSINTIMAAFVAGFGLSGTFTSLTNEGIRTH